MQCECYSMPPDSTSSRWVGLRYFECVMSINADFETHVGPVSFFGYQHVGIGSAKCLRWELSVHGYAQCEAPK